MKNFKLYLASVLLLFSGFLYVASFHIFPVKGVHVEPDTIKFFGGLMALASAIVATALLILFFGSILKKRYQKIKRQKRLLVSGKA